MGKVLDNLDPSYNYSVKELAHLFNVLIDVVNTLSHRIDQGGKAPGECPHLFKVHHPDDEDLPNEMKHWVCPLCGEMSCDITTPVGFNDVVRQFHGDINNG